MKNKQLSSWVDRKWFYRCPFKTRRITTPTENEPARIEEPVVITPSYIRTEEPSEYDSSSIPPKNQSSSIPLSQENTSSMPPSEHKSSSSSSMPPPPSPPQSSSESRCPICNILFDTSMSFRQRTRHVEKCLSSSSSQSKPKPKPIKPTKPKQSTNVNKTPSPSSSKSSTKKSVYEDDDLWEEEPGTQEEEEDSFEDLSSYCVREKGISSSSYSHQIHS